MRTSCIQQEIQYLPNTTTHLINAVAAVATKAKALLPRAATRAVKAALPPIAIKRIYEKASTSSLPVAGMQPSSKDASSASADAFPPAPGAKRLPRSFFLFPWPHKNGP